VKINSTHSAEDRGDDAYFSPPEATQALIRLEKVYMPQKIWEPACGAGGIALPLRDAGFTVMVSDIKNYGLPGTHIIDYLAWSGKAHAIVTNPPYKLAIKFIEKAVTEAPYVAMLLRLNFLESMSRKPFFEANSPARILISSRRLPMMHRLGWEGPKAPSNCCYAWFIWEEGDHSAKISWFDYVGVTV
jgi:hypothetical protein